MFFPFGYKLLNSRVNVLALLALHIVFDIHSFIQQPFTACLPFSTTD